MSTSGEQKSKPPPTPYTTITGKEARKAALFPTTKSIEDGLAKFGHLTLRRGQLNIITAVMNGEDVVVIMNTGGGKSLCYQLPAFCMPGYAVVVCPLLSLMEDQIQAMNTIGVEAVMLSSKQSYDLELLPILERLKSCPSHGGIKLLYVTPEKLTKSDELKRILQGSHRKGLISRFVIDEAHCMNTW